MTNTIWSNEELKQIKYILRSKMLFSKEKDGSIKLSNKREYSNPFKGTYNTYSNILHDEVVKLLELDSKDEVKELIKRHSNTEFDLNNSLHYGLISTLSKLEVPELTIDNPTYCTQIFNIVNDIIGQYDRIIALVTDKYFKDITDPKEIRENLNKIKNNEIRLSSQVLLLMHKVFSYTNNLNKEPLLKDLIDSCNSSINQRIVNRANHLLANASRMKEIEKTVDANYHKIDFRQKYRSEVLESRKKFSGGKL